MKTTVDDLLMAERCLGRTERPEPNGGIFYEAQYRHSAHFIPSNAVRHVMRAAAVAPIDKFLSTARGLFL